MSRNSSPHPGGDRPGGDQRPDSPAGDVDPTVDEIGDDPVLHALLRGCYEPAAHREARIGRLLARLGDNTDDLLGRLGEARRWPGHRSAAWRWSLLAAAAMVLLACGIWVAAPSRSAAAAIERTRQTFERPVMRVYDVDFFVGDQFGRPARQATLYSQSADRFLMHFDRSPRQPAMIGSSGERRWARIGRRTWLSDQDQTFPRDLALDRITWRQIQFNRLLTDLPEHYELRWLDPEPLPGTARRVERVEAVARTDTVNRPRRLVWWLDPLTDLALRVEIEGFGPDRGGPRLGRVVAAYREARPFTESFFRAETY